MQTTATASNPAAIRSPVAMVRSRSPAWDALARENRLAARRVSATVDRRGQDRARRADGQDPGLPIEAVPVREAPEDKPRHDRRAGGAHLRTGQRPRADAIGARQRERGPGPKHAGQDVDNHGDKEDRMHRKGLR